MVPAQETLELFHLVQEHLWHEALQREVTYYPPTYEQDGFTHATAEPDLLLRVANHFFKQVTGDWQCLRMTIESVTATGTPVTFERAAAVGETQPNFEGSDGVLFPHINGGIAPSAVLEVHRVIRDEDGTFLEIVGVTD